MTNWPEVFINKVFCGDATRILKTFPENCIDLVVTSPPYNLGIKYDSWDDNQDWARYYEWCNEWLSQLFRLLKDDGRCCLNHYLSLGKSENRYAPLMRLNEIAQKIGFKHYGLAIWWDITLSKRTAWGSWLSASAPYINSPFEGILILYKRHWKKSSSGISKMSKEEFMESCSGIWSIPASRDVSHPASFPIELAARCIKLLSFENDLVLDPFLGCGTTALAAKKHNRHYIGVDISEKYCDIARQRLAQGVFEF